VPTAASAAPAAPIIPPSAPDDFADDIPEVPAVPAAPVASPSAASTANAAPAVEVAREASNATNPGSASFAEAPSSLGREDDDAATLLPKRSADVAAFLRTPRNLAIAGGAVLLIILLVVAFKGGSKKPTATKTPAVAQNEKPAKRDVTVPPPVEAPTEPPPSADTPGAGPSPSPASTDTPSVAATDTPTSTDPASTPKTETGKPPTTTDPGGATTKKTGQTLGGKQVVLEYDNQARDAQSVPNSAAKGDQSAIAKARTSYAAGNQRLFAGDADGAIRYYRQALAYYPAYVAGYRGLGLAYAQQGNKAQALQALRTYLGSVPNAKDAGLIRKRITTLQSH